MHLGAAAGLGPRGQLRFPRGSGRWRRLPSGQPRLGARRGRRGLAEPPLSAPSLLFPSGAPAAASCSVAPRESRAWLPAPSLGGGRSGGWSRLSHPPFKKSCWTEKAKGRELALGFAGAGLGAKGRERVLETGRAGSRRVWRGKAKVTLTSNLESAGMLADFRLGLFTFTVSAVLFWLLDFFLRQAGSNWVEFIQFLDLGLVGGGGRRQTGGSPGRRALSPAGFSRQTLLAHRPEDGSASAR